MEKSLKLLLLTAFACLLFLGLLFLSSWIHFTIVYDKDSIQMASAGLAIVVAAIVWLCTLQVTVKK